MEEMGKARTKMPWSSTEFIHQVSVHRVWFLTPDVRSDWVVMRPWKLLNILTITFLRRKFEASFSLCGVRD